MSTYISPRMLVRDVVRRHPEAAAVLYRYEIDGRHSHLSIELAAEASRQEPGAVLAALRATVQSTD